MASGISREPTPTDEEELKSGEVKGRRRFKPFDAVRKLFSKNRRKNKDEQVSVVVVKYNSHVVVAPAKLRPGMEYSISVNILRARGDVTVSAAVKTSAQSQPRVASATGTFRPGSPSTINLQMPNDLTSGTYELHVNGTGGLTFSNMTRVTFSSKAMSILVQTDKAMYKPGQTVNFRVLGMYPDLSLYQGTFNIDILDPNRNKIKQWVGVPAGEGVVTQLLELSTQPVQGDWTIKVTAGSDSTEKAFTVAEYVLPKFEVTVELPSYVLDSAASVPVTVSAKYTYGKPVSGPVTLNVTLQNYFLGSGTVASIMQTAQLDNQGRAQLTVPMTDLKRLSDYLAYQTLFTALVTESLTGIRLNGSSTVIVYNQAFTVEFPESNPDNFKPGLSYIGHVRVTQPDGLPVTSSSGRTLHVNATATLERPAPATPTPGFPQERDEEEEEELPPVNARRIIFPPRPTTTTQELPPVNVVLGDNGMGEFQITVPSAAVSVSLRSEYQGVTGYSSISKSHSPSNNYIQLYLRSTGTLAAGGQANFEFRATERVNGLIYQVMSRGSIVATGRVDAGGPSSNLFTIPLTPAMAPNARIVLYYVRPNGEIVTDSVSFDVQGVFRNQVSVSMSKSEAQPADSVDVRVQASPQSTAYLLAVDQSVLLLKSGNDITADQVVEEVKSYDSLGDYPEPIPFRGGPVPLPVRPLAVEAAVQPGPVRPPVVKVPGGPARGGGRQPERPDVRDKRSTRTKRSFFPYPIYYGGSDASKIFRNAGVVVMTDGLVYQHEEPFELWSFFRRDVSRAAPAPAPAAQAVAISESNLVEVERVRSVFPETWLWSNVSVGANGVASVTTTVPDTITSWITSAFAVSASTGLGVASTTAKLRVFRPFFVTLNLPYSVTRGEQVVIQAIVFNYMDTAQDVRVQMPKSTSFKNILFNAGQEQLVSENQTQDIRVPSGEGKSVFFPIVPSTLGNIELEVSARSAMAADAVRRYLLVKPEGVPKEFSVSVLVDLKVTNTFTQTVPLTALPPNVVPDSTRARVTAIGDLMGPSVNGLDSLLQMPSGCGEQNMIGFAPDVFVTSYLKATNQLAGDIAAKAIKYMESGYQRELTYQHKDGSFSAFGERDDSGSMWLTAFVSKTFHQARPYIFIDEDVITRAVKWMVDRQDANGSFPEPGSVSHKGMQGGSGSGNGLTAYVLVALLENNDLAGSLNVSVTAATKKAIQYLKTQLPLITDDYILAMTTYALTLAKDPDANGAFTRLLTTAVVKDGLRYWHKPTPPTTTTKWYSPQAPSVDVEMTSYVLLTYAARNDFTGGLDVMKWLALQRNPHGGFASTQDTVLALQALSEFARMAYSRTFNMQITVNAGATTKQFTVNQNNALVLQSAELPSVPSSLTVSATGSGIALVEVGVFFNVAAEVEEPTFAVTVNLLRDELNLLQISTCARWLSSGTSGMAVEEVGIPSGFEVDVNTIVKHKLLKRTEFQDKKVILYFDEIGADPVCTTLTANRVGLVAKSQPVAVRVFDYYKPENQVTAFYQSAVLSSSSVCDICPECACPRPAK